MYILYWSPIWEKVLMVFSKFFKILIWIFKKILLIPFLLCNFIEVLYLNHVALGFYWPHTSNLKALRPDINCCYIFFNSTCTKGKINVHLREMVPLIKSRSPGGTKRTGLETEGGLLYYSIPRYWFVGYHRRLRDPRCSNWTVPRTSVFALAFKVWYSSWNFQVSSITNSNGIHSLGDTCKNLCNKTSKNN